MSVVIGIDPGVTGALATHQDGRLIEVFDMPVLGGRVDGAALRDLLSGYEDDEDVTVYLEDVHAMPKNGSIASFSLGLNTGIIIGVTQTLSHPLVRVRPLAWKRKMGVMNTDKNALRGMAREIYPSFADRFKRVKDHNRAEAVLISRYGVTVQLQERNLIG
jgi:crossover junction endodeoxyribonuclease RuvC